MNAIEKFSLGENIDITRIKSGAFIPLDEIYFKGIRKQMRGLEELLAKGEDKHDFMKEAYVYKIKINDNTICIKFEDEWCTIGSKFIYCG